MAGHDDAGDEPPAELTAEPLLREQYDWSTTPPSLAIVLAFAELADGPFDARGAAHSTLQDYIDPDALDALAGDGERAVEVSLTVEDYEVHVLENEIAIYRSPLG